MYTTIHSVAYSASSKCFVLEIRISRSGVALDEWRNETQSSTRIFSPCCNFLRLVHCDIILFLCVYFICHNTHLFLLGTPVYENWDAAGIRLAGNGNRNVRMATGSVHGMADTATGGDIYAVPMKKGGASSAKISAPAKVDNHDFKII